MPGPSLTTTSYFQSCVFPVFLIGILLTAGVDIPKSRNLGFGVIWLLIANSSINPILYGLLNKNFRAAFVRILQRCLKVSNISRTHKSPGLSSAALHSANGYEGSSGGHPTPSKVNFNTALEDHN